MTAHTLAALLRRFRDEEFLQFDISRSRRDSWFLTIDGTLYDLTDEQVAAIEQALDPEPANPEGTP